MTRVNAKVVEQGTITEELAALPKSTLHSKDGEYYLNMDALGAEKPEDIDLTVQGNHLIVNLDDTHKSVVTIPDDADAGKINAVLEAGMLKLHVPKATTSS